MSSLLDRPVRYDLAESTCPPLRVADVIDPTALGGLLLDYGTTPGAPQLRALIAADTGMAPGQVLVTVGAIEAMFLLAQDCCDPGDRVVVATPCFPPARAVPEGLGAKVVPVPLRFDDGYRLRVEALADALTPDTRMVSLASPQNPSGVRLTDEELRALLVAVDERAPDAVVLVDETYRACTYGSAPVPPSAATLGPRVVTCSSLSKAHGAPGLRVGWLTVPDPDRYERLRNAKFQTTIACSGPDELLAAEVLRRAPELLAPRAARLAAALDELTRWAQRHRIELVRPDGGALCCLRLPPDGVTGFPARLAARDTRVAPGSWFGEDDSVFRLGFGHLAAAEFTEALDRLAAAL